MKERPILMSTDNVKAILEGRKTQTRRVIKIPKYGRIKVGTTYLLPNNTNPTGGVSICFDQSGLADWKVLPCPYGQVGDRLWVRETWCGCKTIPPSQPIHYKATDNKGCDDVWRPSIFMPRWASRITLEITEIRVERLQEITEEDAITEGCTIMVGTTAGGNMGLASARYAFMKLWDSLNAKQGYPWESNCWVWVITFKPVFYLEPL